MAGTTTNGVTTYPVEVQIEDTDGLLPGMNVSTEIIVNEVNGVVAVPVGAVVRGDKVLVKTGGTSADDPTIPAGYEYVDVVTGVSNDQFVEIKSGVNEGDGKNNTNCDVWSCKRLLTSKGRHANRMFS